MSSSEPPAARGLAACPECGTSRGRDFEPEEFPYDHTDAAQLAEGANFRLETRLGALDVMHWVEGIDTDPAYSALAANAVKSRSEEVRSRCAVWSTCGG